MYYEGLRLLDATSKAIIDVTWDRFPQGEWSEEQHIPDDLQIIGFKVINSDDSQYIRGISFMLGPSDPEDLIIYMSAIAVACTILPILALLTY